MNKKIYFIIGILIFCVVGYWLWNNNQKSNIKKINDAFLSNVVNELSTVKTVEDSIKILENYDRLANLPPYNEQLNDETKEIFKNLPKLKAKQVDEVDWGDAQEANKIDSYVSYIKKHPSGMYVEKAEQKISILEEEMKKRSTSLLVNTSPEATNDDNLDEEPSQTSRSDKNTVYKLQLRKLICNKQQELWGDDRIQIKCKGDIWVDEQRMQVGDEINLMDYEAYLLEEGNVTVTIIERDDDRTNMNKSDVILQVTFTQSEAKKGRGEKSGTKFGGKYTLEYEIN